MTKSYLLAATLFVHSMLVCTPLSAVTGVELYDTGGKVDSALTSDAFTAKSGWKRIETPGSAKGALVMLNGQMAVAFRPGAAGVDVYGMSAEGVKLRGVAVPVAGAGALVVSQIKVRAADADAGDVEVSYKGQAGSFTITYSMSGHDPVVKTSPAPGISGQRLEAPARLAVLPDFFADDMVVDARVIPVDRTEIAGESFFMFMLDGGNSILSAIWDKNRRDLDLAFSGKGNDRVISSATVYYGEKGSIWLAVLERKGIWASTEINASNVKNVIPLEWRAPFRAKWKGDFMRTDHTIDSWEFTYDSANRWRWSGVVGGYDWPCWFDVKDTAKGAIQAAMKFPNGTFEGPFVVYPIDRDKETPLDVKLTITDIMRNSLGIGPCEQIIDAAGAAVTDKGVFTCAVDSMVPALFAEGRQKEERVFLDKMLKETQVFVRAIGDRINAYVEFRGKTLDYLAEQKKAKPAMAEFIGRLEAQAKRLHAEKVDRNTAVAKLSEAIMKEAMADNPRSDIANLTGEETGGIASHGGWQDDVVARSRNTVKILRQMATIEMAVNPASGELCKEIRKRTQQMLSGSLGHEMR